VYYALSIVIHKKKTPSEGDKVVKKTLRKGEDDGASSEKQNKILICWTAKMWRGEFSEQAKFYVNGGKADYSTNIFSHLVGESMVRQKDGDVNCTSSTLLDTVHF
jgi:hypothetical protein